MVKTTKKRSEDKTWAEIRATFAEAAEMAKVNEKSLSDLDKKLDRMAEEREKSMAKLEASIAATAREIDRMAKEREKEREIAAKEREKAAKERAIEREKTAKEREKEREKEAKEREKAAKEREKEREKEAKEREKEAKEREKEAKEREIAVKEREKATKEREISMKELHEAIFGVNKEVKGIAKSNGMVAEDYFYASLDKSKTLGGVHFDSVIRNVANGITLEDGRKINEEFDTLMYNKTSLCIVEVKYKVEKQDVRKLAKKRVQHFKMLFPMYANYKIYLAIGGMTFEKGAVDAAKELGMGVLQLDGDAVVVYDKDLKVY